jgi:prevent-host-death family protein
MIKEVSAVNFRQNLGDMIAQVQYQNDSVIVMKSGKPVAALIDAELFLRIKLMWDRFEHLSDRLADDFSEVPEEDAEEEIIKLIREDRGNRKRK